MKFFVDTADIDEIRDLAATGLLDGVTTNPSLVAKTGRDFFTILGDICEVVDGPVNAEVTATTPTPWSPRAAVSPTSPTTSPSRCRSPGTASRPCRALAQAGIAVNVTLCFSPTQAILVAKAGARFVSPFVGRLDDISHNGMELVADIRAIYDNYDDFTTEILVASVRHPGHVIEAARIGADICTVPPAVLRRLAQHPLTDRGLEAFLDDWHKTGQSILNS